MNEITSIQPSTSKARDPAWAMFIWLPCILAALVLAVQIDSVWSAFGILFGTCALLDFTPVGATIRRRNAEKLVARGYGKRGFAGLATVELAGGLGILLLLALALGDPANFSFGAGFAGLLIAQSISTWRMRAELREPIP